MILSPEGFEQEATEKTERNVSVFSIASLRSVQVGFRRISLDFLPIRHDRATIRNAEVNNIRVGLIAAGNDYAFPSIRLQAERCFPDSDHLLHTRASSSYVVFPAGLRHGTVYDYPSRGVGSGEK